MSEKKWWQFPKRKNDDQWKWDRLYADILGGDPNDPESFKSDRVISDDDVAHTIMANGRGAKFVGVVFRNGNILNRVEDWTFVDCIFDNISIIGVAGRGESYNQSLKFKRCLFLNTKWHDFDMFASEFSQCYFKGFSITGTCVFRNVAFYNCVGLNDVVGLSDVIIGEPARQNLFIAPAYETVEVTFLDRRLSWEMLRKIGALPLFSFSATALIIVPVVAWLLSAYNAQVFRLQKWAEGHADAPPPLAQMAANLEPISLPSLMLASLIGTLFLAVASTLYNLVCPPRVKEFSSDRWMDELGQHAVRYFPKSWSLPWVRIAVAACYGIGILITVPVLGYKLWQAGAFIVRNTTHTWFP